MHKSAPTLFASFQPLDVSLLKTHSPIIFSRYKLSQPRAVIKSHCFDILYQNRFRNQNIERKIHLVNWI